MTAKRTPERCGNCRYHVFDELEGSCVCVCEDSEDYTGHTEHDWQCEKWERKPCLTLQL